MLNSISYILFKSILIISVAESIIYGSFFCCEFPPCNQAKYTIESNEVRKEIRKQKKKKKKNKKVGGRENIISQVGKTE